MRSVMFCGWGGNLGRRCRMVSAGARPPRRDVDKGGDFGINPRLADDGSCPGVAYQHRRPVLQGKDTACGGDVVRKRGQRVLHRSRLQAGKLKASNDFGPTGTVRIRAMDQDDVAGTDRRLSLSLARAAEKRGGNTSDERGRERASINHVDTSYSEISAGFPNCSLPPARAASSAGVNPALENLTTPLRSANVTYYGACISQVLMSPSNQPPSDVQACWGGSNA